MAEQEEGKENPIHLMEEVVPTNSIQTDKDTTNMLEQEETIQTPSGHGMVVNLPTKPL